LVLDAPASAYLAPADIPPGGAAATIRGLLADPDSWRTDVLLRRVVEVLRGTGYSEVLARDILDPLSLSTVAVYGPEPIPPGVVHGYVQLNGRTVDVMETGALGSRGGRLFATVGDINAFYSGLLGGKLVAPSSLVLMKGSVLAEYGLGLDQWQDPCTNGNYYGHAGDVPGYGVMSLSSADANRQITIAVAYPPAPLTEAPSAVALEITSLAQVVLNAGCRFRFG
jgi:D-alanyl-D-alanine carboxypeptidase